jgi:hypothetical protein
MRTIHYIFIGMIALTLSAITVIAAIVMVMMLAVISARS